MRLLYIDMYSVAGHVKFNNTYIEAFYNAGCTIDFVLKQGYINLLSIDGKYNLYEVPSIFFKDWHNGPFNRLWMVGFLAYVKHRVDLTLYDKIIFSGYEEFSLLLCNFKHRTILINHNNISGLTSPIKRLVFKLLCRRYVQVVFEDYIKVYLNKLGVKGIIYVVPHGLPKPFEQLPYFYMQEILLGDRSLCLDKYDGIIFIPTNTNVDISLVSEVLQSELAVEFLESNNILLLAKGDFEARISDNIHVVNNYLDEHLYRSIFLRSNVIVIPYSPRYKYRVSAIFFECVSNNKACLMSNIEALRCYSDIINYNPYFYDAKTFIDAVTVVLHLDSYGNGSLYHDIERFVPNVKLLLQDSK